MFSFLFGVIPPPATTTPTHSPSTSFSHSYPPIPQHAADNASLQLQRRSYEATSALERTKQLESENARLSRELAVLSSTPDTTPHPDTLNVSQLTLAHRRLSERLSFTESLLLEKTQNLESLGRKAQSSITFAEQCRNVLEKVQNNEEAARQKAREMERVVRSVLVEKEFVERTVEEYAELVRKLEKQRKASSVVMANGNASASAILTPTRTTSDGSSPHSVISSIELPPGPATPSSSNHSPAQSLETGRAGLNRLLSEFNSTTESLHQEISRLHSQLEQTKLYLDVERKASEDSQAKLAFAVMELDQYKVDDKAAAKLVERYMKFSQTSIDLLQAALENQKTRTEARVATLEEEKDTLRNSLTFAQSQSARLRDVLDDLTEDISRESHGRRREVALRLKVVAREEHTVAELRRIALSLEYGMKAANEGEEGAVSEATLLEHALSEVYTLVDQLDAGSSTFEPSAASFQSEEDGVEAEGSLARVTSCQEAVASLSHELHVETERRLHLEKKLADLTMRRLVVPPQPEEVTVVAATPSDLGVSADSNDTLVEEQNKISVHPLTPVVQVSRGSSPMEIQQPLPAVPHGGVVPSLEVDVEDGHEEVEDGHEEVEGEVEVETSSEPVEPVAPVVVVAPVPIAPPTLHMEVAVESPKPSPVPQLLSPIVIDTPVAGATTPSVSSSIPVTPHSAKTTSPFPAPLPPLLVDLSQVSTRYESTSTALRNCSALLSRLKADFAGSTLQLPSPPPATVPIFRSYLDRISDFLEDCRVELEIRIADEARLAKGFETMLALPLAAAGSNNSNLTQMEFKIRQFVNGTDPGVAKAVESFGRKVEELEHDIALLKRAIYDAGLLEPSLSLESPSPTGAGSWSWTNLVSPGASRSRPTSPAPTFGAVMTQQRSPTGPPAHLPPSPSHSHHHLEVDQKALDEIINLPFRISMPRPAPPPPMPSLLEPPYANGAAHKSASSSPIAFNPRASLSSTSLNLPTPLGHNRRHSGLAGRPGGQFNMLRPAASAVWSPIAPLNGLGSSPSTPRLGMKADLGHGGSPGTGDLLKDALNHHHTQSAVADDSSDVE